MDFDWTAEEVGFRSELLTFIRENVRPDWTHHEREMPEPEDREAVLTFCRAMGERGFLTPHWPKEYGGREASPWEQAIVSEEIWAAGEPRGPQYMNTNWIGPALMLAGTEEQKAFHLSMISRGDAMWCQGFSEPEAGSDLASLRTSAVRDGDSYIVNGQKIWTSYAHTADYCFLLVRTDPNAERGEGISILLVPMDTPGVEVRDIPNAWCKHVIHEIYFTDAVVPVANRLGDENKGWEIVRAVLANERVGVGRHECAARTLDGAVADAEAAGVDVEDPAIADTLGIAYAWTEAARAMNYAAVNERVHEETGRRPLAAVSRSVTGPMEGVVAAATAEVLGDLALVKGSVAERQNAMGTMAPIAAGSLEVQLNLISRLCLNLPKG
ncbi:MAG: acyl-CoA dehydrogenase family protein [Ilumatobacteraceae bacterium]